MGIPGLKEDLGPGERVSLAKFAINHLQRTSRPLRIAVDISIWLFQVKAAQGGANPALRTLFFRLNRLVALPVQPIFVYDGPQRPAYKRGKIISRSSGGNAQLELSKRLIELFSFQWHTAPGEAEAECAKLQKSGVVDAVISNDVDALMFGSTVTLLNFSKEGTAKQATHVDIYCTEVIPDAPKRNVFLDTGAMVLFALLSGGDYSPSGVSFCGPKLAGEICRAGFGRDLIEATSHLLDPDNTERPVEALKDWRNRLQYELDTNESGYFRTKHKAVKIPEDFPDIQVLRNCLYPVTSTLEQLDRYRTSIFWDKDIDVAKLREFVGDKLGWTDLPGAKNFIRKVAPSIICHRLLRPSSPSDSEDLSVCGRKVNNGMDGLIELKLEFIPAQVVGLDLERETLPHRSQTDDIPNSTFSEDEEEPMTTPLPSKKRIFNYDPTTRQTIWIFEDIVRCGLPRTVSAWYTAQEAKAAAKSKVKKTVSRKLKSKVIDPSMKAGAIRHYGTISKRRTRLAASSSEKDNQSNLTSENSFTRDCSDRRAEAVPGSSQLDPWQLTSSDVETVMDSSRDFEGTLQFVSANSLSSGNFPSIQRPTPNTNISPVRSVDQINTALHKIHISSPNRTRQEESGRANSHIRQSSDSYPIPPVQSRATPNFHTASYRKPDPAATDPETLLSLSRLSLNDNAFPSSNGLLIPESQSCLSISRPTGSKASPPLKDNGEMHTTDIENKKVSSLSTPKLRVGTECKARSTASLILKNTPDLVIDFKKGFWFYRRRACDNSRDSDGSEQSFGMGKTPTTAHLGGIDVLDLTS